MKQFTAPITAFKLTRNDSGELGFVSDEGLIHEGIFPVRAFPISAPEDSFSLIDKHGHEIAWIQSLSQLSAEYSQLIIDELTRREFMPKITRILSVNRFATPSTWQVETDRGNTELTLKAEDYIRRLPAGAILVTDSQGIHFLIPDIDALDLHSRKLLDRFL